MSVRYLFNTKGKYVAFVEGGNVFSTIGNWLGFLQNGNEMYDTVGRFVGYILDDDRVAINKNELPKLSKLVPLAPLPPLLPLSPLSRLSMFSLPHPWKDVFDEGSRETFAAPTYQSQLLFSSLLEKIIHGYDGTPLGVISKNRFDKNSIANPYGHYGNKFAPNSLLNKYGQYGNPYSLLSAFNEYTKTPPYVWVDKKNYYWITRNKWLRPRIDPYELFSWLGMHLDR